MGISQAALADYINVSRGIIGDVENPKRRAKYNLQLINEIAKVIKCSPRDFLPPEPLGYQYPKHTYVRVGLYIRSCELI